MPPAERTPRALMAFLTASAWKDAGATMRKHKAVLRRGKTCGLERTLADL